MKSSSISILFLSIFISVHAQSAKHSPHVVDTTGRWVSTEIAIFSEGQKVAYQDSVGKWVIIDGQATLTTLVSLLLHSDSLIQVLKNKPLNKSHTTNVEPSPSPTPRLDALEKQVQFLIRRTIELEAEIKALSGVKERPDTGGIISYYPDSWEPDIYHHHKAMDTTKRENHLNNKK